MTLEIKKETVSENIAYCIYVDGDFKGLESTEQEARERLERIKRVLLNPNHPETIYSEEI